jgi:hypothetical protein
VRVHYGHFDRNCEPGAYDDGPSLQPTITKSKSPVGFLFYCNEEVQLAASLPRALQIPSVLIAKENLIGFSQSLSRTFYVKVVMM